MENNIEIGRKVAEIIKKMTLPEKIGLIMGKNFFMKQQNIQYNIYNNRKEDNRL